MESATITIKEEIPDDTEHAEGGLIINHDHNHYSKPTDEHIVVKNEEGTESVIPVEPVLSSESVIASEQSCQKLQYDQKSLVDEKQMEIDRRPCETDETQGKIEETEREIIERLKIDDRQLKLDNLKLETFTPVPAPVPAPERVRNPPLCCPVEGCEEKFWSRKAVRGHRMKSHTFKNCNQIKLDSLRLQTYTSVQVPVPTPVRVRKPTLGCPFEGSEEKYWSRKAVKTHVMKSHNFKDVKREPICQDSACDQITESPDESDPVKVQETPDSTHELWFICKHQECGKIFIKKQQLEEHWRVTKHDQQLGAVDIKVEKIQGSEWRRFFCPEQGCNESFVTRRNLCVHQNSHLLRPFVCRINECNKKFQYSSSLRRHHYSHMHQPQLPCIKPTASKPYTVTLFLIDPSCDAQKCHAQNVKMNTNIERDSSLDRGQSFTHGQSFRRHQPNPVQNGKSATQSISCSNVSKQYKHGRPARMLQCSAPACGKIFYSSSHMKAHEQQVHSTVYLKCEEPGCGKSFKHRVTLRRHRRTHVENGKSSVKSFLCCKCDKAFESRFRLKRHQTIHEEDVMLRHKDKQYLCSKCGKIFSKHKYIISHEAGKCKSKLFEKTQETP